MSWKHFTKKIIMPRPERVGTDVASEMIVYNYFDLDKEDPRRIEIEKLFTIKRYMFPEEEKTLKALMKYKRRNTKK